MAREPRANAGVDAALVSPVDGRLRFALEDTGFDEVPPAHRRFYRRRASGTDALAPNEALCPVCHVVVRSAVELRADDRLYCMPCLTRLRIVSREGELVAVSVY